MRERRSMLRTALAMILASAASADRASSPACDSVATAMADAGSSIAELACSEPAVPSDEPETLANAIDAAKASDCLNSDAVASLGDAFDESQTCSCGAGRRVLDVQIGGLVADSAADVSAPEVVSDVVSFAREHCTPGSVDGVLDQDATACVAISRGNASAQASEAGMLARGYACGDTNVTSDVVSIVLARAVSETLVDGEKACSPKPSVRCALTPEHVRNIATAQVAEMSHAYRTGGSLGPDPPCDCARSLDTSGIAMALNVSAVSAHMAACTSGQSDLRDTRPVIAAAIADVVADALEGLVGEDEPCVRVENQRTRRIEPFGPCGPDARVPSPGPPPGPSPGACCGAGFECMVKNEYYSQCRPEKRPAPASWSGDIRACEG